MAKWKMYIALMSNGTDPKEQQVLELKHNAYATKQLVTNSNEPAKLYDLTH